MIRPNVATDMWAIQDKLLHIYMGPPIATMDEALTTLLAINRGLTAQQISQKFDVVPVEVILRPGRVIIAPTTQRQLFGD